MALFGRDRLPARSTLSRFLAALTAEPVEALRTLFLADLLNRPLVPEKQTGAWWIEGGTPGSSLISMARARRLDSVPCPRRKTCLRPFAGWMSCVPPGYTGRKRGQVVRTRTVISQAHS
jgi:hypothetical protein